MESPTLITEENNANKSVKNESIKKGVRGRQGKTNLLRPRTESQEQEESKEKITTKAGKEIRIKQVVGSPHLRIVFYPGGELPIELQGYFTDARQANLAITSYLERKNA